jgi:hypothetical protein
MSSPRFKRAITAFAVGLGMLTFGVTNAKASFDGTVTISDGTVGGTKTFSTQNSTLTFSGGIATLTDVTAGGYTVGVQVVTTNSPGGNPSILSINGISVSNSGDSNALTITATVNGYQLPATGPGNSANLSQTIQGTATNAGVSLVGSSSIDLSNGYTAGGTLIASNTVTLSSGSPGDFTSPSGNFGYYPVTINNTGYSITDSLAINGLTGTLFEGELVTGIYAPAPPSAVFGIGGVAMFGLVTWMRRRRLYGHAASLAA